MLENQDIYFLQKSNTKYTVQHHMNYTNKTNTVWSEDINKTQKEIKIDS
jgi:hypothetical protein